MSCVGEYTTSMANLQVEIEVSRKLCLVEVIVRYKALCRGWLPVERYNDAFGDLQLVGQQGWGIYTTGNGSLEQTFGCCNISTPMMAPRTGCFIILRLGSVPARCLLG